MMSPPSKYDSLLGVLDDHQETSGGYIAVDTSSTAGKGFIAGPLQFFGTGRICREQGSDIIARFMQKRNSDGTGVAVGTRKVGKGSVGFFMFNLPESIVLMRQGMPPGVVSDNDGDGVFRTDDLYYGTIDTSLALIPQADIEQRLFVRVMDQLLGPAFAIPRLWYFPNGNPAVAILTGDGHHTQLSIINRVVEYIEQRGGKFSLIEFPSYVDSAHAQSMLLRGHSVAPHLYYPRDDNARMRFRQKVARWYSETAFQRPRFADVHQEIVYGVNAFKQRVGWQPAFTRTHFLTWWGWDEIPRTYAEMVIRMDLSITGMNPFRQFQLPSMPGLRSPTGYGYINGSGLPMRYTTLEGKLLGVYSQLTQVEDDVISAGYIQIPGNDSLTTAMLKEANRQLIDESVDRFHTALVWNCHPQHSMTRFPKESPLTWGWLTATVDHLVKRGVPMLSVDEWLQFTETRFAVEIHMLPHDPSSRTTEWTVVSPSDVHGLTLALPVEGGDDESLTIVATTADSMRMDVPLRISVVSCEGRRVALISGDFHKNSTIHFRCTQE